MTERVYRLRIPALSLLWFYEVAETPEKAAKQVGDELGGSYIFSRENWEIELCPIEDLAFVLREGRRLRRENNKLFEDKSVLALRLSKAADDVMTILKNALSGYGDDYKKDINGRKYIQWGIVEKDIRSLLEVKNE